MKAVGMRIRIEPELRQAFISTCRAQDLTAALVLRSFMREYILKNEQKELRLRKKTKVTEQ